MAEKYEVVIAGGGHNGLCVGAYLAKAGVKACVVEAHEYVGGGVVTRDLAAPGFMTDICSMLHLMIQGNPLITNDELQLQSKYGLKYIFPEPQTAVVYDDDTYMTIFQDIDKTLESIARYSPKDAEAYKKFHDWAIKMLDMLIMGLYSPTAPFGATAAMMDQSDEGRDVLRAMMMSSLDIINEWFENEKVKIALTRYASELMICPQTKGTGMAIFLMIPMLHKYGGGFPEGGSGVLSDSIARCFTEHGGTIRLNSVVKKFKVENGDCVGVVLEDGEEILASKAVVTNFNVKQVFPDMVPDAEVPQGFNDNVKNLVYSDYQALQQGLALHEAPNYKIGKEVSEAFFVEFAPSSLEKYLRSFDDLVYGIPTTDTPFASCHTLHDPTRAPEGKHTLYLYQYAPYSLKDGGPMKWDEIKDEMSDKVLKIVQDKTTNMGKENIIGRWIKTPLDFERYNMSWPHGDFTHIGSHIWQSGGNRPVPGWNYKTPVSRLYMTGPSTHPGLGVTGGGRAAVQVVMEDLGLDFEKVIEK